MYVLQSEIQEEKRVTEAFPYKRKKKKKAWNLQQLKYSASNNTKSSTTRLSYTG